MWILLFVALGSLWLLAVNLFIGEDWRLNFVRAMVAFQTYLVLLTEALSFFSGITIWGLSIGWGLFIIPCWIWLIVLSKQRGRLYLPQIEKPNHLADWILDGITVFVLLVTLMVALAAAPNTVDSLNYHLPRIAHWAQEGAVRHFPAATEIFNSYSPGAEMQMLHIYVLSQGDGLISLQGWLSFLGMIIAVSALCKELKIKLTGVRFASLFAATMPVAAAFASSTKNDLALAMWVIVVVLMAFRFIQHGMKKVDLIILACAVGLAALTKELSIVILLSFGFWMLMELIGKLKCKKAVLTGLLIFIIAFSLNAGYLIRNFVTYGNITDPQAVDHFRSEAFSVPILISNTVRNASLHVQTPFSWLREWIQRRILNLHDFLGVAPNDPRITVESEFFVKWFMTDEMIAGNPLHAFLLLLSVLICIVRSFSKSLSKSLIVLCVTTSLAFIIYSSIFKWQIFGARYQLSFFLMFTPVFVYLIEHIDRKRWIRLGLALFMLVIVSPWLFFIQTRPVIVWHGVTSEPSIFENADALYYSSADMNQAFTQLGSDIRESNCRDIGIRARGGSLSYLYWHALDKPNDDFRIEYLVAGTPSARYADDTFEPCAVICEDCPSEQVVYNDLPLNKDYGYFKLYLINDWAVLP